MFGFILRLCLICLVLYLVVALLMGGYQQICQAYWWMRP